MVFDKIKWTKITLRSQHSPVAQEAFEYNMHVDALQQGLSQCSFKPQSHCSPTSTKPLPHTGLSKSLKYAILKLRFNKKTIFYTK